jgi:hypothetical protein
LYNENNFTFAKNFSFLKVTSFFIIICISLSSFAQSDSSWQIPPQITFSGYADVFYAFDFSLPQGNQRQSYLANHNRHNEFNMNHLMVQANLKHEKYRANLGLHMGTYVQDNYAQEPSALKYIYQGNIGISLSKKNKLWLDVGIFESHIGFEVAQSTENQTLTRSLCAELSPYFFGGAKLSYDPNEKWSFKLLALNGWQRIQRLYGNSMLSFGSQIQFQPNEKWLLNWSTFVGTDTPDEIRRMRYFSNFYTQFKANEKLNFTLGWDYGMQEDLGWSAYYRSWTNLTGIAQYKFSKQWQTAFRFEFFSDIDGVLLADVWPNSVLGGFSLNIDYSPHQNLLLRWENRFARASSHLFNSQSFGYEDNFVSVLSLALKFGK